ncbi:MAG TPA: hypothetical protein VJK73_01940 [Candidatus Paceibacterota bacterium]
MKKSAAIFFLAFALNVVWENLHSFLYSAYMGGTITEYILVRASLFDALLVMFIVLPFIYVRALRERAWLIIAIGILIAIGNEWYGLGTGRWAYNSLMPIVPLLKVGLTPALQLGVLGYVSYVLLRPRRSAEVSRR